MDICRVEGSFRDPSGFLYWKDNKLYRHISPLYKNHYDFLISSGLYDRLVKENLLVQHSEEEVVGEAYRTIQPEVVPFISYPYEWSFSQLKDAALLTLKIQEIALLYGMTLKDGSAYNVQFRDGKPVFIDTLSFEIYKDGQPWMAYKQFCQHFLAPLSIMSYSDIRLSQMMRCFIDGIPLDLASRLLPKKTYMRLSLLLNIHLHAKSQKKYEDKVVSKSFVKTSISRNSIMGLVDNIKSCISSLTWKAEDTEWVDYYQGDSYTQKGFESKKKIIAGFLDLCDPKTVWDLGANDGYFSRIAAAKGSRVIAFDIDPACVENNYKQVSINIEDKILPLLLDLTNPIGGIGWDNEERSSLKQRGPADLSMALALVHHLAISNNVPLNKIAKFFRGISQNLIIEFVPKEDAKVKKLLGTREDIFHSYNESCFEKEFSEYFNILSKEKIEDSLRVLYLMKRKAS